MELINTVVDTISLWLNVAIVLSGGGQKIREVKPCQYSKIPECRVVLMETKIELLSPLD